MANAESTIVSKNSRKWMSTCKTGGERSKLQRGHPSVSRSRSHIFRFVCLTVSACVATAFLSGDGSDAMATTATIVSAMRSAGFYTWTRIGVRICEIKGSADDNSCRRRPWAQWATCSWGGERLEGWASLLVHYTAAMQTSFLRKAVQHSISSACIPISLSSIWNYRVTC